MGIAILLMATFAIHSPMIATQSPAVQKAVRLLGERNQAAIAKIKTLTCSYRIEYVIPPQHEPGSSFDIPSSGQYFRKGNDYYSTRCVPEGHQNRWDVELKKGDRRFGFQLYDNRIANPIGSFGTTIDPHEHIGVSTFWGENLLIQHVGPRSHFLPDTFSRLLTQPHLILSCRTVVENSSSLEYVKLRHANGTLEFWFDPGWNGWIRKSTFHAPEYSHQPHHWEVKAISRSQDGDIIPMVIDRKYYDRGQFTQHARMSLSDVHLNSQFQFTGLIGPTLEGSLCEDQSRNTRYLIDGIGNRIGPETPIPLQLPPGKRLYPFDVNVGTQPNGGVKEALSNVDLALYAAALIASMLAIGWIIRNRRSHISKPSGERHSS